MAKTYKIRKFQNGRNKHGEPFINYSLTIPTHIAERLPQDQQFSVELTKDGILFRPTVPEEQQVELPEWATKGAEPSNNGHGSEAKSEKQTEKPKQSRPRPGAKKTGSTSTRKRPAPAKK